MSLAEFPDKLKPIFQPARHKVLYGGRGGAKSHSVAKALLIKGTQEPLRVLCARELQNSISESVHKLLSDQIYELGLEGFYTILKSQISGPNGTEFFFEGIRNNTNKIKSYEGIDVCWVEEAQAVTSTSWGILTPTIRKPNSEIWITFNPNLATDATYKEFVVNPKPNSIIIKINWRDNPWFPDVLKQEMEHLKATNYDSYLHVWEGNCVINLEGTVYAKQLRDAYEENRICRVPYTSTVPVWTSWDLGRRDQTAVWFWQTVGFEFHMVDYYENSGEEFAHYLEVLQNRHYLYGNHYLPHDAKAKTLGTKKSIEERLRAQYPGHTIVVPRLSISDGLDAGRTLFKRCYFDETNCAKGLERLQNYKFERIAGTSTFSQNPLHDDNSNGADAYRTGAVAERGPKKKGQLKDRVSRLKFNTPGMGSTGWLRG